MLKPILTFIFIFLVGNLSYGKSCSETLEEIKISNLSGPLFVETRVEPQVHDDFSYFQSEVVNLGPKGERKSVAFRVFAISKDETELNLIHGGTIPESQRSGLQSVMLQRILSQFPNIKKIETGTLLHTNALAFANGLMAAMANYGFRGPNPFLGLTDIKPSDIARELEMCCRNFYQSINGEQQNDILELAIQNTSVYRMSKSAGYSKISKISFWTFPDMEKLNFILTR